MVPEGGAAQVGQIQIGEPKAGGQPAQVKTYRLEASVDGDLSNVWPKLEEHLKAAGWDEKKVLQIRGDLEKAAKLGEDGKHRFGVFVARSDGASAADRFMIGVACSPTSEALRAQLKLGPAGGLLVDHVSVDSPAKKAGIQLQHSEVKALAEKLEQLSKQVQELQEAVREAQAKRKLRVACLANDSAHARKRVEFSAYP